METLEINAGDKISTSDIVGPEWPLYHDMQVLLSPGADHELTDIPGELADLDTASLNKRMKISNLPLANQHHHD